MFPPTAANRQVAIAELCAVDAFNAKEESLCYGWRCR